MASRKSEIIAALKAGGAESEAFFAALPATALEVPVYTETVQWSVRRVLAHFITIERSMQNLFENILAGGPGAPEDFDVDRFNRTQPQKLDGLSMDALLENFRNVRAKTVAMVAAMAESDLDREGRHPFHGHGKLERFIRWAYEHARLHEDDVRRALEKHAAQTTALSPNHEGHEVHGENLKNL
ncbi:MAG: DinB family protein [Pseudomonadota bacterium]